MTIIMDTNIGLGNISSIQVFTLIKIFLSGQAKTMTEWKISRFTQRNLNG